MRECMSGTGRYVTLTKDGFRAEAFMQCFIKSGAIHPSSLAMSKDWPDGGGQTSPQCQLSAEADMQASTVSLVGWLVQV